MQLGMIGLGRMGAGIVRRLLNKGHDCVVYDTQPTVVASLQQSGARGTTSVAELVANMTRPRANELSKAGYHYVDVGTSGGVAGLDRGYCLMIGGEADVVEHLKPIFSAFVPGVDAATRTPDATGVLPAPKKAFCTAARTAPVTSSR